jgi:iron(III) transport system ATP-binding protein
MDQTVKATTSSSNLQLRNLTKVFGQGNEKVTAVDSINLDINPGEFITFLGPSGCGKTTTLRMIAGFETPTAGSILLDGQDMSALTPDKRPMGMVFQSYALFPHMSVYENVAYGPKTKKMPAPQIKTEVEAVLESMSLTAMAHRSPNQLSGGQQQRVALARAMVMRPQVLLFDEPLSNLDAKLRAQMRIEIREVQQRLGITSIFVTHDQDEAMSISDRIVVMRNSKIEQVGLPAEIYLRPASVFVADFIGISNFLEVASVKASTIGMAKVAVLGKEIDVLLRADDIQHDDHSTLLAEVVRKTFRGADFLYTLKLASGVEIFAFVPSHHDHAIGERIGIHLVADHVVTFS